MAETKIPWARYSWNPWFGCEPVHTGCRNCYAKNTWFRLNVPAGRRKRAAKSTLRQPFAWNRKAKRLGIHERVILGSISDLFEDHPDVGEWRRKAFETIYQTPHLDWIIPTKRPEHIRATWRIPAGSPAAPSPADNITLLVSVSDQETFNRAATVLWNDCRHLVRTLGFSIEPLIGPIKVFGGGLFDRWDGCFDWLVIGGESGPNARPCDLEWIRDLVKQGKQAGVPVYVKQWGDNPHRNGVPVKLQAKKGADPSEWPQDLQIHEYPKSLGGES